MAENEQLHNPLEYRPAFSRSQTERTAWEVPADTGPTDGHPQANGYGIGHGLTTDIIARFEQAKSDLRDRIVQKERAIGNQPLTYSDADAPYVKQAKEELGLDGDDLTLKDYKEALHFSNTPAGDYLLNLIEDTAEGIDGDIRWETYADYVELEKELVLLDTYVDAFIYQTIDFTDQREADWQEKLLGQESQWGEAKDKADTAFAEAEAAYRQAYLYDRNERLGARARLYDKEAEKDRFRYEGKKLENSLLLLNKKVGHASRLMYQLDRLEAKEQADPTQELLALTETDQEKLGTLNKGKLYLKRAVDSHNKEKHHLKNTLRQTFSDRHLTEILDDYRLEEKGFHRQGLPLTHYMRAFQGKLSKETEQLLEEMARGLSDNKQKLKDKFYEFEVLQDAMSGIRQEKISEMDRKQTARLGYQGFVSQIEKIKTGEE